MNNPENKCLVLDSEMQCSLPVMESLRKEGFQVTAGSYKKINMGFYSRFVSNRVVYPSPEFYPDRFLNRILDLVKTDRFAFILPLDDFSTGVLSAHKNELAQHTKLPIVSWDVFIKARDKAQTMKAAMAHGIPCPTTYFPNEESIDLIGKKANFPVLVKTNIGSGARGIALVETRTDLETTYAQVKQEFGECHIQEFVPKGGLQYKADLFLDMEHRLRAGIVYSKLRYFPVNGGSSVVNRTVEKPDIVEHAYSLLKALGWYGFADFDFITDPRDGVAKVMEINPRMPNTFRISMAAGINFPKMIAQMAMGEEVSEVTDYKKDVYLRYLALDILWFLKSPERFKATPSFFKFFGLDFHDQILSVKDPGPMVGFCLDNILGFFDRGVRKSRYSRGW